MRSATQSTSGRSNGSPTDLPITQRMVVWLLHLIPPPSPTRARAGREARLRRLPGGAPSSASATPPRRRGGRAPEKRPEAGAVVAALSRSARCRTALVRVFAPSKRARVPASHVVPARGGWSPNDTHVLGNSAVRQFILWALPLPLPLASPAHGCCHHEATTSMTTTSLPPRPPCHDLWLEIGAHLRKSADP